MDTSSPDISALIADLNNGIISSYCGIASIALVLFEYLLLLREEVTYFWIRKLTGATSLFLANRYITLLFTLYFLISGFFPLTTVERHALDLSQYAVWAAFSALRALALCRLRDVQVWKARAVALVIFLLAIVPVPINILQIVQMVPVEDASSVVSRASLISADVLVILVTWYTLVRSGASTQTKIGRASFADVLLRDGSLYFLAMSVLNALHIALTVLEFGGPVTPVSFVTTFTDPLTSLLVSRFLVHLQSVNRDTHSDSPSTLTGTGLGAETIRFERMVGSLGASINAVEGEDGEDEDWYDDTRAGTEADVELEDN
ncbi:uncharacterized protein BXZ73DRAFT_103042 [Epithele typhae]|uniref:uncharacterized protein n=1 Tax=Epithele typhae TaxID=378194 RepID=UPI002007F3EF|nr:uncharacterized protein BXZ73DRAFT_103042 [Epithele typhae]KAH9925869.1 hypothetical protein BXZ73DRAFT_103042 [Epithele typhae]